MQRHRAAINRACPDARREKQRLEAHDRMLDYMRRSAAEFNEIEMICMQ